MSLPEMVPMTAEYHLRRAHQILSGRKVGMDKVAETAAWAAVAHAHAALAQAIIERETQLRRTGQVARMDDDFDPDEPPPWRR